MKLPSISHLICTSFFFGFSNKIEAAFISSAFVKTVSPRLKGQLLLPISARMASSGSNDLNLTENYIGELGEELAAFATDGPDWQLDPEAEVEFLLNIPEKLRKEAVESKAYAYLAEKNAAGLMVLLSVFLLSNKTQRKIVDYLILVSPTGLVSNLANLKLSQSLKLFIAKSMAKLDPKLLGERLEFKEVANFSEKERHEVAVSALNGYPHQLAVRADTGKTIRPGDLLIILGLAHQFKQIKPTIIETTLHNIFPHLVNAILDVRSYVYMRLASEVVSILANSADTDLGAFKAEMKEFEEDFLSMSSVSQVFALLIEQMKINNEIDFNHEEKIQIIEAFYFKNIRASRQNQIVSFLAQLDKSPLMSYQKKSVLLSVCSAIKEVSNKQKELTLCFFASLVKTLLSLAETDSSCVKYLENFPSDPRIQDKILNVLTKTVLDLSDEEAMHPNYSQFLKQKELAAAFISLVQSVDDDASYERFEEAAYWHLVEDDFRGFRYRKGANDHFDKISDANTNIEKFWSSDIMATYFKETPSNHRVRLLDGFTDLAYAGTLVLGSCQSLFELDGYAKHIVGTILDATRKLLVVENTGTGGWHCRAMLDIVLDADAYDRDKSIKPIFVLQSIYTNTGCTQVHQQALNSALSKISALINIDVAGEDRRVLVLPKNIGEIYSDQQRGPVRTDLPQYYRVKN